MGFVRVFKEGEIDELGRIILGGECCVVSLRFRICF